MKNQQKILRLWNEINYSEEKHWLHRLLYTEHNIRLAIVNTNRQRCVFVFAYVCVGTFVLYTGGIYIMINH